MPAALRDLDLFSWPFLAASYAVGAMVVIVLVFGSWGRRAGWVRWLLRLVVLAAGGLIVGWAMVNFWGPFGVALSGPTQFWICVTLGALGVAIGNLWSTRWWSKVVAIMAIPALVLVGVVGINADIGEFQTPGALVLGSRIMPLVLPPLKTSHGLTSGPLSASWVAPSGMPSRGRVGTVTIPGTVSHFRGRSAVVYLPPAALVVSPPRLPVLIVMSGQPGEPSDIINKADMAATLDSFARDHHGLAPIVVIPDQLGASDANPMCVDSPLGNSATYLTVDVPAWITRHLRVSDVRHAWAVAGFSQGGTCAIQLGAENPALFGSILDVSGELAPRNGTLDSTIGLGFGGSRARYDAATPLTIMAGHAPYVDTVAIFGVGQNDSRYASNQKILSTAAENAGMSVTAFEVSNTAHDWHCAKAAFARGLDILGVRFGL